MIASHDWQLPRCSPEVSWVPGPSQQLPLTSEGTSERLGPPPQARLRLRGSKTQPAVPCQPQLIAEEEVDDGRPSADDASQRSAGASLALLRRLTALIEEARSEDAAAAVLECPELLAIDVDLRDEQVCACTMPRLGALALKGHGLHWCWF